MRSIWSLILLGSLITYHCLCFAAVSGEEAQQSVDASQPTFESCKPYVDAALKTGSPPEGEDESSEGGTQEQSSTEDGEQPPEESASVEDHINSNEDEKPDSEETSVEQGAEKESQEGGEESKTEEPQEDNTGATTEDTKSEEDDSKGDENQEPTEDEGDSSTTADDRSAEEDNKSEQEDVTEEADKEVSAEAGETVEETKETESAENEQTTEGGTGEAEGVISSETVESQEEENSAEAGAGEKTSAEVEPDSKEQQESKEDEEETRTEEDDPSTDGNAQEDSGEEAQPDGSISSDVVDEADQSQSGESKEDQATQEDQASTENAGAYETEAPVSQEEEASTEATEEAPASQEDSSEGDSQEQEEEVAEPYEPRSRDHVTQILGLDDSEQTKTTFNLLDKVTQTTLKELKTTYEHAIKPLEHLYKYRDLSNRHFGDPEIFSKPLIVFMGPWSGGKSTIINWLLGIQHDDYALRTGADPSPAQFNIMMYGKEPERLDGTQLAADWTFSGLQKFGQSFLDRLRGQKLPNRLLEKVNIVEIPGILEVRKQVERSFPFNDACQWFIDRADTLFLIYDPAKLDIGPETEAILDQLKGRENQVRIVLNKADTVKPDELLRVQAMLVWNISPLMSSAEPPVLYAASLWDRPLQVESPKSLLVAHENSFLKDIRDGIERRVETRIAAARRFAVRVRNHAKMVDCYLNTYNNHRSFFSDRKKVSTDIIDHPQNYHIYEGLSTLTNISRYDLPDPDTYRDFFRLNPLWEFPTLQSTCSFWRGCPLHKLDIAIAYDLPEILGKFRRQRESIVTAKSISKN